MHTLTCLVKYMSCPGYRALDRSKQPSFKVAKVHSPIQNTVCSLLEKCDRKKKIPLSIVPPPARKGERI